MKHAAKITVEDTGRGWDVNVWLGETPLGGASDSTGTIPLGVLLGHLAPLLAKAVKYAEGRP